MNQNQLAELAVIYISDLVDQLAIHQAKGDEINMAIVHAEIKSMTEALDSIDASDNFFYAADYRHIA